MKYLLPIGIILCGTCLGAVDFADREYQRYDARNWTPRIDYAHVATNWWTNAIVPCVQGVASKEYPGDVESGLLAEVRWLVKTNGIVRSVGDVAVWQGASFADAVDMMMDSFADRALVSYREPAAGPYARLGDRAYVEMRPQQTSVLDFVRNNVFVSICSTDLAWSTNTAFAIDAAILNASTNAVGGQAQP